jgi:hypothetical protein
MMDDGLGGRGQNSLRYWSRAGREKIAFLDHGVPLFRRDRISLFLVSRSLF